MNKQKNTFTDGLIPPHAIEVEQVVLGSIMVEQDALSKVINILSPECFYAPAHKIIYEQILKLNNENQPIDLVTVCTGLMSNEIVKSSGGISYISGLTSKVGSAYNLVAHAQILKQKYIARELILACAEIQRAAFDESVDIADVITEFNASNDAINQLSVGSGSNLSHIGQSTSKALLGYENRAKVHSTGGTVGIDTGLSELNQLTGGGWKSAQLIVLAARPAMGKSALLLHFAKSAARQGKHVCIYSLEMSDVSLANRLLLSECDIDIDRFKFGSLNNHEVMALNRAAGIVEKLPIYTDDRAQVSMSYIRNHSRLMAKKGKCDIIFIDYLQLTDCSTVDKGRNRENEIAQASRLSKIIAKELDVPVVLLSQLSRNVESRTDKRPMLSDLRESGAIEQDADIVTFIYRPAYYDIQTIPTRNGNIDTSGLGILCIEKQRDGATGTVKFKHNETMTKITDYE